MSDKENKGGRITEQVATGKGFRLHVNLDKAMIPPRIFLHQRTILVSALFSTLFSMALYTHIFYLPFYFQAVKDLEVPQKIRRASPGELVSCST
ncbi:hypothetical protein FIBSPDRAFT_959307 [Athelia psychrophila]|uniref:Uncharacterized protein n=1 Tax=Athelia psychrophila TaxID=1759441 RepID=A0A166DM66_9AGAM|nr:hypothetical protein FIBSPDRAFT_959307 [Fibularhizoctonia sp. CBS 109695]